MIPPCSVWAVWEGFEVEGDASTIGRKTLFIRRAELNDLVPLNRSYGRVWFTKEFDKWYIVEGMIEQGKDVHVESTPLTWAETPKQVREKATIWLKLGPTLRPPTIVNKVLVHETFFALASLINFVATGVPFAETVFKVAAGRVQLVGKVRPENYLGDRKIL